MRPAPLLLIALATAVPGARAHACSSWELRRVPGGEPRLVPGGVFDAERIAGFVDGAEVVVRALAVGAAMAAGAGAGWVVHRIRFR